MANNNIPIPIHGLALLQAYLFEMFTTENKCEKNFKHTEWYLRQNFSNAEIEATFEYLKNEGIICDCDVIKKIDLKKLAGGIIKFHN